MSVVGPVAEGATASQHFFALPAAPVRVGEGARETLPDLSAFGLLYRRARFAPSFFFRNY
jgi:hypothetical protein